MTHAIDKAPSQMRPSMDMKTAVMVMTSLLFCACDDGGGNTNHLDAGEGSDGGGNGVACSTTMDLAAGSAYTDYTVMASQVFSGTATAYESSVTSDSPCDRVLKANDGTPYSPTGDTTASLTFRPTLPGDYTIALKATTASGMVTACGKMKVTAPGLRVELCSDGTQQTDIDLHVHRPGTTAAWFSATDDCFFNNCIAQGNRVNWGLATSAIGACSKSPNGSSYTPGGNCPNPRMDSDTLDFREFESTSIDNPPSGMPIRVMAHYYGGSSTAIHPVVAIYCNGTRKAVYGAGADQVMGFNKPGGLNAGSMWRVADVTMNGTDCTVTPLHPPNASTGYFVTTDDPAY